MARTRKGVEFLMNIEALGEKVMQLTAETDGVWSVVLKDLESGEEWMQEENKVHTAASIIKLPIMATVFRLQDEGKLRLSDRVEIRQEDLVGGAGVLQHMTPGSFLLADLVMLMIIQSDNTATNVLIEHVSVAEVQATMRSIPMDGSTFYNKLMTVPAKVEGVNQLTAADVASLLDQIVSGKFSSVYACEQMIAIMKKQQIHYITAGLPDPDAAMIGEQPAWEFASKTGNVTGVWHDVGILYGPERTLRLTILSTGCTKDSALATYEKIGLVLYDYVAQKG